MLSSIVLIFHITPDRQKYDKPRRGLKEVPDIPSFYTKVDISSNDIKVVRRNAFAHLYQCWRMDLRFNEITRIETGAFNGLKSITELELGSNRLESLSPGMFTGLGMLRKLTLFRNKIGEIEDWTFQNMTELTELSLDENQLRNLTSRTFAGLSSLKKLELMWNRINIIYADVLAHIPRPFELGLGYNSERVTNDVRADEDDFRCESPRMCWLKQEELGGNITWAGFGFFIYKPDCAGRDRWDKVTCHSWGECSCFPYSFIGESMRREGLPLSIFGSCSFRQNYPK